MKTLTVRLPDALVAQLLEHSTPFTLELRCAEAHLRIDQIDHVVGNAGLIVGGRLGGTDIHAPVDLHRVDRDDMSAQVFSQAKGQVAFSGCGRSEERQYPAQSKVPRRWWGAAVSIVAARNVPGGWWPATWTTLFPRLRAVTTSGSLREGPSTRTSTTLPTCA